MMVRLNTRWAGTFAAGLLFALGSPARAQEPVDFQKDIQPIFAERCYSCHGAEKVRGKLRLDVKEDAFKTREKPAIVPGDAEASNLYKLVNLPIDDYDIMPAEGDPLTKEQIALIKRWIDEGAVWPDGVDPVAAGPEKIELKQLTDAEKAAEQKAMSAVAEIGALAMRIAADSNAVDVNMSLIGANITDEHLKRMQGLEHTLIWLNLARTGVTDAGAAQLARFGELRQLHLENTKVGDAALSHVGKLTKLEYLNLYGTNVSNSGLEHLKNLRNLRKLYLWQTQVTEEGVAALQKALPELQIDIGRYKPAKVVEVAEPPTPASAKAINATCPVSGQPVKEGFVAVYQGQNIGLCCDKCKAKFEAKPEDFIGKVPEFKPAPVAGKPINAKCPVSGKDVDPAALFVYKDQPIGFCCNNCKAKFEAKPEAFIAKVAEFRN